ncbi:uncharacterized protein LOC129820664 isoform X1 [Salvelinus fontinalis]|uniref:uncharacterized protein LOC129820664 isoform X1 n=1 Tax=Salvelinus fontinalis TaxID=8038 RepID=UPI002485A1A6|nr:uncharacterized protein LOC129820664 isoform X1 [Salvelinus fontinalis]
MYELRRILDRGNCFIPELKTRWGTFYNKAQFYGVFKKVMKPPLLDKGLHPPLPGQPQGGEHRRAAAGPRPISHAPLLQGPCHRTWAVGVGLHALHRIQQQCLELRCPTPPLRARVGATLLKRPPFWMGEGGWRG